MSTMEAPDLYELNCHVSLIPENKETVCLVQHVTSGTVAIMRTGSVSDALEISLENGGTFVAVVTRSSRNALSLEQGRGSPD
ncbi:hypothetical protein SLY17_003927 [Cronobacter dublinensis]|uniref:hypothetical protein n=1 Tax=Cronobacter dublinensis TaxID=413497 RepID=UPI002A47169F|nr:hypothetical protein [Cronobacter dublinensis]